MSSMITIIFVLAFHSPEDFDQLFTGETLRFDYFHSGTAREEHISLDEVRREGNWPGSRVHLIDDRNLGKFLFSVIDRSTNRTIYSRGFCSIFGEWETIGEARKGIWRTFHESQRFPEPRKTCQLLIKKRATDGTFREIFSTTVDPGSRFVNRSPLNTPGRAWSVFESGPPRRKVDLLILGDGYGEEEMGKYRGDVRRLVQAIFEVEPFRSHREDFNVRAIDVVSARSGVTHPRKHAWNDTPLGMSSNAFDVERYMLTYKNRAIRELAALAPYDALILLANTERYGGGGIFNLWLTCTVDSSRAPHVIVHELGHSLGGLADEYYTSEVAYEDFTPPGMEPWEPNVTALLDPGRLKWRALVEPATPIPTPWDQKAYDKVSLEYQKKRRALREAGAPESELDTLSEEFKKHFRPLLEGERLSGKVGAFEGAAYQAKGFYRPELDCIMFSPNRDVFCRVCRQALERIIRLYAE